MLTSFEVIEELGVKKLEFTTPGGTHCKLIVPHDINDNELNQKAVDKEVFRWDVAFERLIHSDCYDDSKVESSRVYVNGEVFSNIYRDRTDKSVELKVDLSDAFPEYKEDKFVPDGLDTSFQLTRFTAFEYYLVHERTDGNIVLFKSNQIPIELLSAICHHNVYRTEGYSWGFNHNMSNKTKTVIVNFYSIGLYFQNQPDISNAYVWKQTREHDFSGGVVSTSIHLYNDHDLIRDFCNANNITEPMPQGSSLVPYSYEINFSETTGDINYVGAYANEYKEEG